jgi:hypothetical protein
MFARKVYVRLKPNGLRIFAQLMEREVFPWLQRQQGFLESIVLVASDGVEVQVLSFWDEGTCEEYDVADYPAGILQTLEAVLDEITYGRTFKVVSSTLELHARIRAAANERRSASAFSGVAGA